MFILWTTISIDGRDKSVAIKSGKTNMCDVKEGNGMKRDGADKFWRKKGEKRMWKNGRKQKSKRGNETKWLGIALKTNEENK